MCHAVAHAVQCLSEIGKERNVRELRTASTMPTDFEGSWADMHRNL